MSELDAAAGYRRDHGCQTPDCPNDFAVITLQVDTSEVTMLCDSCHLAFSLAVLQQLAESGAITLPAPAPESVAPQPAAP